MRIAYYCNYVGKDFRNKYLQNKKFALSGILKSQGIARALLKAGHEVVVYSPALTICNCYIHSFTEEERFDEGTLVVRYPSILSFRKCTPFNIFRLNRMMKKDMKKKPFDVFIYYNISIGSAYTLGSFMNSIKVLEYEDNIFNKNLVGEKRKYESFKKLQYDYVIPRTDGVMAVCKGMLSNGEISHRILTPGIVNEEVLDSISQRVNKLDKDKPVKIFLTGGTHYSKGSDLMIGAMKFVKTPCCLEIFGNGEFYQKTLDEIKKLPSYHEVHLNGYMPHGELIQVLDRDADILINTTRSMGVGAQSAGFPFKMMEYASTGRPIVSSELGKYDDDFNSHVTYYEGEDPKSIAKAIEEVIEHYDEKVLSALELQKRVTREFSIEGTSIKIDQFLKDIVGSKELGKQSIR